MTYTIVVTEDDIKYGRKGDPQHCPIAEACRRVIPTQEPQHGVPSIGVLYTFLRVNSRIYDLPFKAVRFIKNFDADKPVDPFTFELEILT